MNERRTTVIVIIAVLCVGVLFYLNSDTRKRFNWFENYRAASDQPYGAAFIRKMVESYRPQGKFIFNDKTPLSRLLEDVSDPANTDYVFIGESVHLDEKSSIALARFIESGGNALIASLTPPETLINEMYHEECGFPIEYEYHRSISVDLNFYHGDLKTNQAVPYAFRFGATDTEYFWEYFSEKVFCDSTRTLTALGHQDSARVNFVRIRSGKGNLYLHSNPVVFTNYFLTDPAKVAYASGVFSHLDGKDIIWDEFSKIPVPNSTNSYDSPLYYIMQQPSLKYAWWLLLATVLIYVVFGAKRMQRVIPVIEAKSNTSLEFVNMISRLHYKNGNHLDMAHKKMKYFLYFVRSKYGIHTERFNEAHIRRLAEKSKVNLSEVEVIFSRYYLIEEKFKNNIEANRLVDLYDSIDNFYRQSK